MCLPVCYMLVCIHVCVCEFTCVYMCIYIHILSDVPIFYFVGNYQKALETYRKIHERFPENLKCKNA